MESTAHVRLRFFLTKSCMKSLEIPGDTILVLGPQRLHPGAKMVSAFGGGTI